MAEVDLTLGMDTYILLDESSSAVTEFSSSLPSLMFRIGELYVDPANHRPLLVTNLGNDLVTFQDVTFPDAPGDEFTMPLFDARVRLLQTKFVKIADPA